MIFCTGDAWNMHSEGTGVGDFQLFSPAEGTSALALVRLNSLHACAQMDSAISLRGLMLTCSGHVHRDMAIIRCTRLTCMDRHAR